MANRNLVEYFEDRQSPDQKYDFKIDVDRSAAGQPGLLVISQAIFRESSSHDDRTRSITVVVKDGVALLAPVLEWLFDDDLVEEVAKEQYKRFYAGGAVPQSWDELRPGRRYRWEQDAKEVLMALVAVGLRRKEADTTEDGH